MLRVKCTSVKFLVCVHKLSRIKVILILIIYDCMHNTLLRLGGSHSHFPITFHQTD